MAVVWGFSTSRKSSDLLHTYPLIPSASWSSIPSLECQDWHGSWSWPDHSLQPKCPFILGPGELIFLKSSFTPQAPHIWNADVFIFARDKQHATLSLCLANKKQSHVWDPQDGALWVILACPRKGGSPGTLRTTQSNVRGETGHLLARDSGHCSYCLSELTGESWNAFLGTRQRSPQLMEIWGAPSVTPFLDVYFHL